LLGPSISIIIRIELRSHVFIIIFFTIIPFIIGGFGNFLFPILGSPHIAYPRMKNIRFYILILSGFSLIFHIIINERGKKETFGTLRIIKPLLLLDY
ncbi:Cytochrome c oxidase subunit 1, partial [Atta colombica]